MVNAQTEQHGQHAAGQAVATATSMSSGEVTKVDKDSAKIAIKHGPLIILA